MFFRKLNKQQFEKWVNALRTTPLPQAFGELYDASTGGICALGLLEKTLGWREGDSYLRPFSNSVQDLNDKKELSFSEIADVLEKNPFTYRRRTFLELIS